MSVSSEERAECECEWSESGAQVERESRAREEREWSGGTRRKSAGDPAKRNVSGAQAERTARRRSAWGREEISRLRGREKTRWKSVSLERDGESERDERRKTQVLEEDGESKVDGEKKRLRTRIGIC